MTQDHKTEKLLAEILEVQRAQLDEYRRVTAESLQLQRRAVYQPGTGRRANPAR